MNDFDFQQIEKKWQDYWSKSNIIECDLDSEKDFKKFEVAKIGFKEIA